MDAVDLYRDDVVTWADRQVEALRALARRPELSNAIDWENVIEEIETVGRSEWKSVENLLVNALAHALKIAADPNSLSAEHWKKEVANFSEQARMEMRPSMRARIDIDEIWRRACKQASIALQGSNRLLPDVSQRCPYSFDELREGVLEMRLHLGLPLTPGMPAP